uniref:Uncharacterized protein n=1 Tax=Triticum urartu TaxID=4572 RepID=A0A8R7P461_TRIUA
MHLAHIIGQIPKTYGVQKHRFESIRKIHGLTVSITMAAFGSLLLLLRHWFEAVQQEGGAAGHGGDPATRQVWAGGQREVGARRWTVVARDGCA